MIMTRTNYSKLTISVYVSVTRRVAGALPPCRFVPTPHVSVLVVRVPFVEQIWRFAFPQHNQLSCKKRQL